MSKETYANLRVVREDGVAHVTIDNPPVNVLSAGLMADLRDHLTGLAGDESVRVIVFDSVDPEFFIAHVDMMIGQDMAALGALAAQAPEGVNVFQAVGEMIRRQPQVTIVKLAGIARGGGAEFVAAADMTFAAIGRARIGQVESLMGIVPSGGGTQYLVDRVGRNRALEMVLSGDAVDAKTAELYGWVNRALPDDELDAYVDGLARNIAALPAGVIQAVKRILPPDDVTAGYRREEAEWGALITQPASSQLMTHALETGAQTRDGERNLEELLRAGSGVDSVEFP